MIQREMPSVEVVDVMTKSTVKVPICFIKATAVMPQLIQAAFAVHKDEKGCDVETEKPTFALCELFQKGRCDRMEQCSHVHVDVDFLTQQREKHQSWMSNNAEVFAMMPSNKIFEVFNSTIKEVMEVPVSELEYTRGLFLTPEERAKRIPGNASTNTNCGKIPTACLLYFNGTCKWGQHCNQAHVNRQWLQKKNRHFAIVMTALREEFNKIPDSEFVNAYHPLISEVVRVPKTHIAQFTRGLFQAGEKVPSVCLLFLKGRCSCGDFCKQIHVCAEWLASVAKADGSTSGGTRRRLSHTSHTSQEGRTSVSASPPHASPFSPSSFCSTQYESPGCSSSPPSTRPISPFVLTPAHPHFGSFLPQTRVLASLTANAAAATAGTAPPGMQQIPSVGGPAPTPSQGRYVPPHARDTPSSSASGTPRAIIPNAIAQSRPSQPITVPQQRQITPRSKPVTPTTPVGSFTLAVGPTPPGGPGAVAPSSLNFVAVSATPPPPLAPVPQSCPLQPTPFSRQPSGILLASPTTQSQNVMSPGSSASSLSMVPNMQPSFANALAFSPQSNPSQPQPQYQFHHATQHTHHHSVDSIQPKTLVQQQQSRSVPRGLTYNKSTGSVQEISVQPPQQHSKAIPLRTANLSNYRAPSAPVNGMGAPILPNPEPELMNPSAAESHVDRWQLKPNRPDGLSQNAMTTSSDHLQPCPSLNSSVTDLSAMGCPQPGEEEVEMSPDLRSFLSILQKNFKQNEESDTPVEAEVHNPLMDANSINEWVGLISSPLYGPGAPSLASHSELAATASHASSTHSRGSSFASTALREACLSGCSASATGAAPSTQQPPTSAAGTAHFPIPTLEESILMPFLQAAAAAAATSSTSSGPGPVTTTSPAVSTTSATGATQASGEGLRRPILPSVSSNDDTATLFSSSSDAETPTSVSAAQAAGLMAAAVAAASASPVGQQPLTATPNQSLQTLLAMLQQNSAAIVDQTNASGNVSNEAIARQLTEAQAAIKMQMLEMQSALEKITNVMGLLQQQPSASASTTKSTNSLSTDGEQQP